MGPASDEGGDHGGGLMSETLNAHAKNRHGSPGTRITQPPPTEKVFGDSMSTYTESNIKVLFVKFSEMQNV